MKKYIILFASILSLPAIGQDLIVKHQGSNIHGKVTAIGENSITYTYEGETVSNSIGKAAVSEVVFASGRKEAISGRVSVSGKSGWENVMITANPNDVIGLTRKGEVKAKSGGYGTFKTMKGNDRKATERLKKEAAELGAHMVYVIQHESKGSSWTSDQQSLQSGVAYGY